MIAEILQRSIRRNNYLRKYGSKISELIAYDVIHTQKLTSFPHSDIQ